MERVSLFLVVCNIYIERVTFMLQNNLWNITRYGKEIGKTDRKWITRTHQQDNAENTEGGNEIKQAQQELFKIGTNISSICMRLEGTKYEDLAQRMKAVAIALNNALIKDIRGEKE